MHGHFQARGKRAQGYAGFQCGERKVQEDDNMENVQSVARLTESEIPWHFMQGRHRYEHIDICASATEHGEDANATHATR